MTTNTRAVELLPQSLIDLIGEYGMARTDGLSDPDRIHLWEMLIREIKLYASRAAITSIEAPTSEPVKYEQRMRAPNGNCGPWHETSAEMHARYSANPDIGDGFSYERRALFAAPAKPVEAPLTDAKPIAHGHRDDYYLMANARNIAGHSIAEINRMPNCVFARKLFGTGSTSAHQICHDAGIDPDDLKVERARSTGKHGGESAS